MFASIFLVAVAAGALLQVCLRRRRVAMLVYDEEANVDGRRKDV